MMTALYEQCRPKTFAEVIGQAKALKTLDTMRQSNGSLSGQVLWLAGPSGTGKTTIARLVAAELSDAGGVDEIDGSELTVATLENWVDRCRVVPMFGKAWVFIVNEAHLLRGAIVSKLQNILEKSYVQRNSTWIFTTTFVGETAFAEITDSSAFLSRVTNIPITSQGLCPLFAERAQQIATELGLNGKPIAAYKKLVERCHNNMRQVLGEIAAGRMLE